MERLYSTFFYNIFFLNLFRYVDLSYNDIPFITKKMFPENRWIPYRLEVMPCWR